ncbi:MAG: polysaccharide deacetylase family protein, partial [Pirellulaceae bacterium]
SQHAIAAPAQSRLGYRSTNSGRTSRIAITLDLEMARNFPTWESTHWDYEKGNLDPPTKSYAREAARRVRQRGGVIHFFAVGQLFEQEDLGWLKEIVEEGHPVGNHTYDHVNVLAGRREDLQYRFQRAPWLLEDRPVLELIRENILRTTRAMEYRLGVQPSGFRTPGGFSEGLKAHPAVRAMLMDLGYSWVSSLYPAHPNTQPLQQPDDPLLDQIAESQKDAQPFVYPDGLIEIPMSPISDIGAFRNGRWNLDSFLRSIEKSVRWSIENGTIFDFLAHPSCLGVVDPEFQAIDLICRLVKESEGQAELANLATIATDVR